MSKIINLNKRVSIILKPKAPFNFDATVFKPSHFPTPDRISGKKEGAGRQ